MRRVNRSDKASQLEMWKELEQIRELFPWSLQGLFVFASLVLEKTIVGQPKLNRTQKDILAFLFSGGRFLGVQASRGMTKTVMAAIFCCFCLIHMPDYRIIVFSQNGKRAKEIAGWVVKIFNTLEILDVMLPDTYAGDRSSVENFDIHWLFRGADKSPSVTCYSIESGAQGARADLILADDIESLQNSRTTQGREWLLEQSLEFESINQYGRIIYLGTPQSVESIYNTLPGRGYVMRIWPGRYPTIEQMDFYGDRLAPMLRMDIEKDTELQTGGGLDGKMGKPTTPAMYDELTLQDKELKQGLAKFMLQFMVNTGMADRDRYKLKLENLTVINFNAEQAPVMPVWNSDPRSIWQAAPRFGTRPQDKFYFAMNQTYETRKFDLTLMFIDPSGGGSKSQDEMGYAVTKLLGTYVYLYRVGGVRGGYHKDDLMKLVMAAKEAKVDVVYVEKNFGNGAHFAMLKPLFEAHYPECRLEEVNSTGQKEIRIIDTLEPLLGQHRLIVSQNVVMDDYQLIQQYPAEVKMTYSLFYQMGHITADRNSLRHDDRLDALAGAVAQIVKYIDYDQVAAEKARTEKHSRDVMKALADPELYVQIMSFGSASIDEFVSKKQSANALSKYF